ncbi:peptide ABC transporter ATP-binding protein [bacterium SCGC AG-212-C10]|nr:peptide ABC transporter ATP-binding protein [bacterium SCGC AG-212-C10]
MWAKDAPSDDALLELKDVSKHYSVRGQTLKAVDHVSIAVRSGSTLGVVGESGCGKTTLARMMLRMEKPTLGSIYFRGRDVASLDGAGSKLFHRSVSAVFQDPYSSLNPRHRVEEIVLEPLKVNLGRSAGTKEKLDDLLRSVGLPTAAGRLYPHEFSGGQRQRIAIARAISVDPALILLDEPVSALDVSIRAQVLNLLKDLQSKTGVAYVFIAHDLGAVRHMSDDVVVMYLGSVVEAGRADTIYKDPKHPYSQGLLEASLPPDPRNPKLKSSIEGELPSPINPPSGCKFRTRCPIVVSRCAEEVPEYREVAPGHFVACHLAK